MPKATTLGAVVIDPWSQSDDLIAKNCGLNFFRTSTSNSMIVNAIKTFVKQSGVQVWDLISVDYSAGHDLSSQFSQFMRETGGKVNANLFEPFGTSDFGTYISQLSATNSEGLLVTVWGTDALAFAKQQAQFRLFKRFKMVFGNGFTNPTVIAAQGDTVLGMYETLSSSPSIPNAKNQAFVKAFAQRFKHNPSCSDADIFVAVELLRAAIEKAKSTETSNVRNTLAGLKIQSIYGDAELRSADHQLIRPEFVTQVVKNEQGKFDYAVRATMDGPSIAPPPSPLCKL